MGCLETNWEGGWGGRTRKHEGFIGLIRKLLTLNCLAMRYTCSTVFSSPKSALIYERARFGDMKKRLLQNGKAVVKAPRTHPPRANPSTVKPTITATRDHPSLLTNFPVGKACTSIPEVSSQKPRA